MADEFNKTDIRKPRNEDFEDTQARKFKDGNKDYGTYLDSDMIRDEEPTDKDGNVLTLFIFFNRVFKMIV
jgi:hypothetical protein